MKFLKYIGYFIAVVIVIIIVFLGSIYYSSIQRVKSVKTVNIEVAKGISIPVEKMFSQRRSLGHAISGGGHVKNHIKFNYNNIEYLHKTRYILEVIKLYEDTFYLIYYDRVTNTHTSRKRFYKSTKKGDFTEVKVSEFPKHIAK